MGGIYDSTIASTKAIGMSSVWSCVALPYSKFSSKWILALELVMVAGKVIGISVLSSYLTSMYSKFSSTSILALISTSDASWHMSIILMSVVTLTDGVGLDNVDELDECNRFDAQDDADEGFLM